MKKILFVHWQSAVVGGAEIALIDLIHVLKNDYEITNLFHKAGKVSDYYIEHGMNVVVKRLNTRRRKYPGLHFIESIFMSLFLKKNGYEFVICNTLPAVSRIHTACKMSGVVLYSFVRDHFSYSKNNNWLLSKPKKIIAVSESMRKHVKNFIDYLPVDLLYDYIECIPNYEKKTSEKNLKFRISIIGRIQKIKQIEIAMLAFLKLKNYSIDAILNIYGEPGPAKEDQIYFQYLKSIKNNNDFDNSITFNGFTNEIHRILFESDLLIVASSHEAFPRIILEAQLCGVPVIASKVGGIPEQITDLETGLLFNIDSENPEIELLLQIVLIFKNIELRMKIIQNSKNHCKKNYSNKVSTIKQFKEIVTG
jgi:glycosyltransferase involved in cell wall biosynthesis